MQSDLLSSVTEVAMSKALQTPLRRGAGGWPGRYPAIQHLADWQSQCMIEEQEAN